MRIVFLGSPDEVIAPLKVLQSSAHEVVAVLSQPAREVGRGRVLTDPPVARFAKEQGFTVLQPASARDPQFLSDFAALRPDVAVTAAYGQILSEAFLSIPRRATINIHPSLLPKYRGATPVPAALLDQCSVSGVTILFTVKRLDAGPIILQKQSKILSYETADQLTRRLFEESGSMLLDALDLLADESFQGTQQDESAVTLCGKISKEDGRVDWGVSARILESRYRAFQPWPGLYAYIGPERIGLRDVIALDDASVLRSGEAIFEKSEMLIKVGTGQGTIGVKQLQKSGSKWVDAAGFWNGQKIKPVVFT